MFTALLYFLCLSLYGGLFDQQFKRAPPLPNILRLDENAGQVWARDGFSLGFSYWLIFVSMVS